MTADATNWVAIGSLYSELEALTGSPVVRLNRAVAVAETDGPDAGLELLADLDTMLATHHRLHAVRAELARRAGDHVLARHSFVAAIGLCQNDVERDYLRQQLNIVASQMDSAAS